MSAADTSLRAGKRAEIRVVRDLGAWREYVDAVRERLAEDAADEERFLDESCQDWLAVAMVSPF